MLNLTSSLTEKAIRMLRNTNKITYEEERVALILGTTAVFTVWWMIK